MSKFQEMKHRAAANGHRNKSVESGAHVKLTGRQALQALRGEGQMALTVHVEGDRKEAFSAYEGEITVEVEGQQPVTFLKLDHNIVWASHQPSEKGFESIFNALWTDEFNGKIEELQGIGPKGDDLEDDVVKAMAREQRKRAKKVRSVLPAKITFDEPQPVNED